MNGSTSQNLYDRESLEDTILDNYVAFLRYIRRGEKRIHVNGRKIKKDPIYQRQCARCGTMFSTKIWSKKFCGERLKREGCTWWNIMDGVERATAKRDLKPKMTREEKLAYMRNWHRINGRNGRKKQ